MARPSRADSVQSPLDTYLKSINDTPLLSRNEERELAYRIEDGDIEARDQMVRANLRLVVNIARKYVGKGLGLQDLIAEGNLGLIHAVELFDTSMSTRFSTYASYWITETIKRALIKTAKPIRLPKYMMELVAKWRNASNRLQEELGRPPTQDEITKTMQLPEKKVKILEAALRVYNAAPQTEQDSGPTLDEMLSDGRITSPDDNALNSDTVEHVMAMLDQMDPREATILQMRYGLNGQEPQTLKAIGEHLDLTRERVRQIEKEALSKLSQSLLGE